MTYDALRTFSKDFFTRARVKKFLQIAIYSSCVKH